MNSAIGQQHRNKVQIQTNYILDVISKINHANILIIGCGSGRDIRNIQSQIEKSNCNFYLNDIDENAINFTKDKLSEATLSKVTFINESVLQVIKNKKYSSIKYDLILFGGVFDYLSDKAIIMILKKMYNLMLAENGLIIFTNIKANNPFKYWMEYVANWTLIERTESDCINICNDAQIPNSNIKIYSEGTSLTLIVEIKK